MRSTLFFWLLAIPLFADSSQSPEQIRKSAVHISGHVLQKLPDGYLVRAVGPVPLVPGKAVDFNGPEWKASQLYTPDGIPILHDATIFLISSKDWVDGDSVEINASLSGEFSYTNTLGAQGHRSQIH